MPSATLVGVALFGLVLMGAGVILVAVMLMRRMSGGRAALARQRESGAEVMLLSAALQEAVVKLKAQERANAARAEASERRASQIVDGLTSGLLVVDRAGRVETINPAARRILNIAEPAVGKAYRRVLSDASGLAHLIEEALASSQAIVRRTVTIGNPLRPTHLGVSVSPMTPADGSATAVCLFTDLTAVVELEEQLRLKEALARLGELTAGLAHEFRNGLATIHGYGRLLDPATLPESQRACVEGIRDETAALGEVVTNFLRFAKPDPLALQPVDLRSVIARSIDDVPGGAEHVTLQGAFGDVQGDEVLLRQAFANLVRNGLEACTAIGVTPRVVVSGSVGGGSVRVTVDDNGPGIPPESLERVFQPFVTTKASGTGLGLAIVQKVIVSHNGRVTAGNRPEGGAEFTIKLPLAAAS
ncbi:MAG: two-component system sensor histidine kinase NtrB [Vicinamibacterales bacterium]